ncbi:hypothetical protein GGI04_005890, partial [Coemansia thaxteri]
PAWRTLAEPPRVPAARRRGCNEPPTRADHSRHPQLVHAAAPADGPDPRDRHVRPANWQQAARVAHHRQAPRTGL